MNDPKTLEEAVAALAQAMMDVVKTLAEFGGSQTQATKLYTYDDLAEMFGKSKSTVRQWVCAGEFGEPVKAGSSTRVTQAGLDKFIADHSGPMQKQPSKARTRTNRAVAAHQGQPLGI